MNKYDLEKQSVINASGNLLVMGGPGSGKTTIALMKARQIVLSGMLQKEQLVLFLSFARSTISRVEQHAQIVLNKLITDKLEINTYHSFMWTILRSHGYLIYPRHLGVLPPHEASARLAEYNAVAEREREKYRLVEEEGLVHFDLFAPICAKLLAKSNSLTSIISETYPFIFLDEFQDTNVEEWAFIAQLGRKSNLIALADPEQRIYDFRGADPARISQFTNTFNPSVFDFGNQNNRSSGTDIVKYGNDLLSGDNKKRSYNNVKLVHYSVRKNNGHLAYLKVAIMDAYERLKRDNIQNWSIAILLPSNGLMLAVSDYLGNRQEFKSGKSLPRIRHEVAIETAGPSIAAVLLARLIEYGSTRQCTLNRLLIDLSEHIRGRQGDKTPSKNDLTLASSIVEYTRTGEIRGPKRLLLIDGCNEIVNKCNQLEFTGDVALDWVSVRELFSGSPIDHVERVKSDLTYLRLLHKGSFLYSSLSDIWCQNYNYIGATEAVRNALTQDRFATSAKTWSGVNVMTMHKAKGKEFDEVLIFEGAFPGQRFIFDQAKKDQARRTLRVAVTRAKRNVIIFTPKADSCSLL